MTDYRALIASYLNHEKKRKPSITDVTIKKYTGHLTQSIDFLEAGHYEPDEAYYSALEAHLLGGLAKSTTDSRVSLARRFFTWALKQQGERLINMTDIDSSIPNSDEEASKSIFNEAGKANIPEQVQAPIEEEPVVCPPVEATPQQTSHENNDNPDDVMHPQTQAVQESSQATSKKTGGRPKKSDEGKTIKLSVYLTPTLDADLQDLARLQRLPTAEYIFRLIEKERDRRADALATFRTLVDDD